MNLFQNKTKPRFHFIGIGGYGMTPLAEILWQWQFHVQGSDSGKSENLQRLKTLGIDIATTQDPSHIQDVDCVVYSTAIKPDNPEYQAAQNLNIPLMHRPQLLAEIAKKHKLLGVAGTHGKTTTTGMIAQALHYLEMDPTVAIGGVSLDLACSGKGGSGSFMTAELDESDGSFLQFHPERAIISNIEDDHLDYYHNSENVFKAFLKFASQCKEIVIPYKLLGQLPHPKAYTFGYEPECTLRILEITNTQGKSFCRFLFNKKEYQFKGKVFGRHNVENMCSALLILYSIGIDMHRAIQGIEGFSGVKRRQTCIYESKELIVYDDYAHNPVKIKACLQSIRDQFPERKLVGIFQPHRYSRLLTMYDQYLESFDAADLVLVLPVYSAGEEHNEALTPERVTEDLQNRGIEAKVAIDFDEAAFLVRQTHNRPLVVTTLGAGSVTDLAYRLKLD